MKQILNTKGLALSILTLALTACGGNSDNKTSESQNQAPVIMAAGDLTVKERDTFSFSAQASGNNGSIKSFVWEQTAGTTVELSNTDTNTIEFIAPDITEDETITLKLSATDNDSQTTSKEFVVTINAYAQPSADVFPDKALLACMNISRLDMGTKAIECKGVPIRSLEGLQTLSQLVSVKIESTYLEGLEILGSLTQLEDLTLHDDYVDTDYSALNNLTALKSLSIYSRTYNSTIDLSNFQNLTSLTLQSIYFSYDLFDISELPTSLTELHLSRLEVYNARALSSLSQLEKLSLDNVSNIDSLSFLSQMPNLKEATLANLNVSDISALASTPNLEKLVLRDANIEDFSIIGDLTKLTSLALEYKYIGYNRAFDINTIKTLSELATLSLRGIELENTAGLNSLSNLTALTLSNNNLTTLSFLASLEQLIHLTVGRNAQAMDISWIVSLPELAELTIDDSIDISSLNAPVNSLTKLSIQHINTSSSLDIAYLSQLNKLEELDIFTSDISNIGSISDLTELQHLSIQARIDELPNISKLSRLTTLTLTNNHSDDDNSDDDIGLSDFTDFGANSSLTSLKLKGFSKNEDLTALAQFSALEELEIWESKATSITPISHLKKLKRLTLSDFPAVNHMAELMSLGNLESLAIYSAPNMMCADLEASRTALAETVLLELPDECVESLVDFSLITDDNLIKFIRENAYYDVLALDSLTLENNNIVSLTGLEQYSNLKYLRMVSYDRSEHVISLLNSLNISPPPNLSEITISSGSLTTLRDLTLPQTVKSFELIYNETVFDLEGFHVPYIEDLNLSSTPLSNSQLLANYTNLTSLDLDNTRIPDLTPLHSLTQLRMLDIYWSNIDCAQVAALEAALPNTQIRKYSNCN
ncbi:leucine-rich repeat domain-containing protein [Pseudoalteromonas byunsanensis]|uniref:Uncharacterized protein n=1 Tax=Pseudoalteromonas byunsanensis TaxID=327939 RepID=A0A1S1N124_9GAMM|nr:leucine-rich repeat domain-containing protein [Pseudoalteromonas byunsanensis]OHU93378.1 hypothetical protein BIW53_18625 [Pseudoalteromonas byunsanensis]